MLHKIDSGIDKLTYYTCYIGALIVFALAFLICGDVIGRIAFHHPIIGTTEIAQNMTAVVVFLMVPRACGMGQQVRSTLIVDKVHGRVKSGFEILAYLFGVVLFIGILAGSWEPMIHATKIKDFQGEVFSFPLYPVWWVIIYGTILSLYQCAKHFIQGLRGVFAKTQNTSLEEVR